jgi:hypothetical protein
VVEEGGRTGEDTTEIKRHTDGIMEVQDQINEIIDKEDEYKFLLKEKKWLIKELENLSEKENILYRDDIFKRIVDTGIIYPESLLHLI